MPNNRYQKMILEVLGTKPISFNPDLARALGSVKAGLLLSQFLYWNEKGHNPNWVYKTIKEMEKETALSRNKQDNAIKICEKFGVLEKKVTGIPAKRYFKVNIEKIIELLESSLLKNNKQVCESASSRVANKQQTNTENTSKNTPENSFLQNEQAKACSGFSSLKKEINKRKKTGSHKKEKPFFRGEEMRWSQNKWWVIPREGGQWLEFAGEKKDIDYK